MQDITLRQLEARGKVYEFKRYLSPEIIIIKEVNT